MAFWVIAVPNERNAGRQLEQLKAETADLCECTPFVVPAKQMKVGTLDSLMALSDDLTKIDTFIENVAKKAEKTVSDLTDQGVDKNGAPAAAAPMFIERDRTTPEQYVQSFQWKHDRFNPQTALKDMANAIFQECTVIDEELKAKMTRYLDVKASLAAIERKEGGSLAHKPLESIVAEADLGFSKEKEFPMVQPVLVVVPKSREDEWKSTYEKLDVLYQQELQAKEDERAADESARNEKGAASASAPVAAAAAAPAAAAAASAAPAVVVHLSAEEQRLADYIKASEARQKLLDAERNARRAAREAKCPNVVPRSSKKIAEDEELILFRVFVLAKGVDAFKTACKDRRFTVRTVDHANATVSQEKDKRGSLETDKNQQLSTLIKWCKSAYADVFVSWMHLKAVRVFVESVLRYGLPVDFQAHALKPVQGKEKKLRQALADLYSNLGGSHLAAAGEDEPVDLTYGEYYPYVSVGIEFGATSSE